MKPAPYFRVARPSWALLLLSIFIGVWLLSGPAGFGPESRSAEAALLTEVRKIVPRDPGPDFFGWSVAVSGDTAVVGAVAENSDGAYTGAAYIFQRNQDGVDYWGQVKKIHAYDAHGTDQFGMSVAISGDTVVVGANGGDLAAIGAGAAYIFQRDAGGSDNWGQVKKLLASDAWEDDDFGISVAVSGDTIVVGAYGKDTGATDAGAAYVFQRDQGGTNNWGQVTKILASDAQAFDRFGSSVAVSGDTATVGAYKEDGGSNDVGAAYIFERDEGGADNWGEVKKLSASDAHISGHFGSSVAVSGDTATVGAPDAGYPSPMPGAAYVFERDEGGADNWGEVKKLSASDAGAFDQFGISVAVSGDTAVVGAYARTGGGFINQGGAYAFQRDQGGTDNWGEETKLTASDAAHNDYFGISVAVSGDITLVGAYHSNSTGAVYAFHEPTPTSTPIATPTDTPTPTSTATTAPTNTPAPGDTPTNTPPPAGTPTNTPPPADTPTSTPTAPPTNTPVPTDAPANTATPTPTETPAMPPGSLPGLIGDVNCDGIMNSIDAALVLQFEAGLIDTVPCPDTADVNEDGRINSIDAALILQTDAGLIAALPRSGAAVRGWVALMRSWLPW